jgi:hypothetical protein
MSRFHLKMETESNLRNVMFWKINRTVFLDKGRKMDNVQKHNICTNVPSSQKFRSYLPTYLKQCITIWGKHVPSCPLSVMAMGNPMFGMRRVRITHQPALVRYLVQQNFLIVQYGTLLCQRISCKLFIQGGRMRHETKETKADVSIMTQTGVRRFS